MNKIKNTHKIILLGPQACGKGTQGKILSEIFGIERISTGEIFREEIAKKTDLGLKIQNLIAEGQLISDELTFKLLKKRLAN
ncbi:MAG: nucleoside monophosphate kinase, partial [Patescibacteria group bacterium]